MIRLFSPHVLRGWQCPEILHESLQPGFTTGVKLSAQIIPFFICRNSPEDMIYKYSSRRHEIQGRPGAANHVGLASLFMATYWCHRKGHILNLKLQITTFSGCNEVFSFIRVVVSRKWDSVSRWPDKQKDRKLLSQCWKHDPA